MQILAWIVLNGAHSSNNFHATDNIWIHH